MKMQLVGASFLLALGLTTLASASLPEQDRFVLIKKPSNKTSVRFTVIEMKTVPQDNPNVEQQEWTLLGVMNDFSNSNYEKSLRSKIIVNIVSPESSDKNLYAAISGTLPTGERVNLTATPAVKTQEEKPKGTIESSFCGNNFARKQSENLFLCLQVARSIKVGLAIED